MWIPFSSASVSATPLRTLATNELVVPKSIPAASRCSCGAVDCPGSDICNNAMIATEVLLQIFLVFFEAGWLSVHRIEVSKLNLLLCQDRHSYNMLRIVKLIALAVA